MTTTVATHRDRPLRRTARLAWVACGVSLVVATARVVLAIVDPASSDAASAPKVPGGGTPMAVFEALILVAMALIGAVVAFQRPRNPIGWILSAMPLFLGVLIFSAHLYWALALGHPEPSDAVRFVAWLASWIWIPVMVPTLTLFPLLFPTGRPPTRRWRWVQWVAITSIPMIFVGTAFVSGPFDDYPQVVNPFGAKGGLGVLVTAIGAFGFGLGAVAMLAAATSLVVRYRRSKGEEREQIKWVASAAVLFVVIFLTPTQNFIGDDAEFVTLLVGLLIVAAAVAASILKYRLYDIDIVINKTVVFVVLVGFITAVYAGIVVGLGRLLPVGQGNLGLAVVATAVVAVVFEPVRARVQHWANRLVYGQRATPYETLAAMTASIGDSADPGDALGEAARLLAQGTGAAQAVVWVARDGVLTPRAVAGDVVDEPAPVGLVGGELPVLAGVALVEAVRHEGKLVGALSLAKRPGEGVNSTDRRLVAELAGQAALLLANTRLRSRLGDRLVELRTSRQRMITAQDRARHALERDLHDGAQQELVALKVKLGLARTIATREGDTATAERLAGTVLIADRAVDTLRDVARGIYPPLLESEGLAAALSTQARRADLDVTVLDRTTARYPRELEATAYFCALEALRNAVRHANADNAHIELDGNHTHLVVTITDDGDGFNPDHTPHGDGLTHMADRIDATNGTLTITSAPRHGTTITLNLPTPVIVPAASEPELAGATP